VPAPNPAPKPTHLDLWKRARGGVPEAVWERTDLEALVLADNALVGVSERIGRLTRLRTLDLGHKLPGLRLSAPGRPDAAGAPRRAPIRVAILDDYFDTLRTLPCFARLAGHDVTVWADHVQDTNSLAARPHSCATARRWC
jgi:hypothetical protein